MPVHEITDAWLRNLTWARALRDVGRPDDAKPIKQITYLHRLQRGLSLVLVYSAGGTRTFRVMVYVNGKPVTTKLGSYPALSLKEAKAKAEAYYNDPAKYAAEASPDSFREVAEDWFKRRVENRGLRSAYQIRRHLEAYIYPKWGGKRFLEIRRADVNGLLDYVEDKHGRHQADGILATIRNVMVWYQSRNENYLSPIVKGMRRSENVGRSRTLTDDELRQLWAATEGCYPFGAFVRMLLLTAQRRTKVANMRWDDVTDGVWTIATEEREKGNASIIRLPDMAIQIITQQPRLFGNPFVFAGRHCKAMTSFSSRKNDLDRKLNIPNWTLHDLRRTARSLLSKAGVKPHIAERVLGHRLAGVEGVYDRHSYSEEIGDALALLASQIERIVHPPTGNVVHLRG